LEPSFKLEEESGYVTFVVKTKLKEEDVTKCKSSSYIHKDPTDYNTFWVSNIVIQMHYEH